MLCSFSYFFIVLKDAQAVLDKMILGKKTVRERLEAAQLREEHPDLIHGAKRDYYGRKREV